MPKDVLSLQEPICDLQYTVFLLSPASMGGKRGKLLLSDGKSDLAAQIRRGDATLGEAFAFISSLYFRGKLAYAEAFAQPPPGLPGALVITAGTGLVPPQSPVNLKKLARFAETPIHLAESRYRLPLERDCRALLERTGQDCSFVLLGSVATTKYLEPLSAALGKQLRFPIEFVGKGDLGRGGLLLRCVRERKTLTYCGV